MKFHPEDPRTDNKEPINEEVLQELERTFVGKPVKVTHTGNSSLHDIAGICKAFHMTESGIDMELDDGQRIGFYPDTMTDNSVESNMSHAMIAGKRKIELAE